MISQKIIGEYCSTNGSFHSTLIDLLPQLNPLRWPYSPKVSPHRSSMADLLHSALKTMTIDDDEPITLPDDPRFRVFDQNSLSILGRLLNPDCQSMSRMIIDMPRHWRVYNRVRGIALSRDKFQFIFEREEDLVTVLRDRPWSFNHWTMLLERWTPSPPPDFLTKFEIWIRIRNIPHNYYTVETMEELAKAIGKVVEIAYDPKVSQKSDFIRAKVLYDIAKPARDEKVLNIKDSDPVIISYEYEKIRRKCNHCFRLTHEKPKCPVLRKASNKPASASPASASRTVDTHVREPAVISNARDGPPGFPLMFPELSARERQMALLYISHPDDVERTARIKRVELGIEESKRFEANATPALTYDVNKGKGLVYEYKDGSDRLRSISLGGPRHAQSASPASCESSDQSSGFSMAASRSTGFAVGSSSGIPVSGTSGLPKKTRNRPPSWKRRGRGSSHPQPCPSIVAPLIGDKEGASKRKAEAEEGVATKRSNSKPVIPVASVLKPLLPQ